MQRDLIHEKQSPGSRIDGHECNMSRQLQSEIRLRGAAALTYVMPDIGTDDWGSHWRRRGLIRRPDLRGKEDLE